MGTTLAVIALIVLCLLYLWALGWIVVGLFMAGGFLGYGLGSAVAVLGLVSVGVIARETYFGFCSSRLSRKAEQEHLLDGVELTRGPSGKVDRDEARAWFTALRDDVEAHPETEDDWRTWYRLSIAYDAADDRKQARSALRRAIALERTERRSAPGTETAGGTEAAGISATGDEGFAPVALAEETSTPAAQQGADTEVVVASGPLDATVVTEHGPDTGDGPDSGDGPDTEHGAGSGDGPGPENAPEPEPGPGGEKTGRDGPRGPDSGEVEARADADPEVPDREGTGPEEPERTGPGDEGPTTGRHQAIAAEAAEPGEESGGEPGPVTGRHQALVFDENGDLVEPATPPEEAPDREQSRPRHAAHLRPEDQ